ncbi:helix-turn-helix transcriptional regulator [Curtobacterium sp. UCD-KPL2560]|uniref:helix-turn-helix domain-containing protein n=1 Tax=Curtobacterium sp. UCD-KPL2560 TaxID=1885315 RepID=UPI001495CB34|nr:helix-turn-helix transcriptional regulator [Curtobacterium sp. UCD-KPL2560]
MEKSVLNEALAAEIRAERARKKVTIKELALAAGMVESTLNRALAGQRDINVTQIGLIARALSVDPSVLVTRAVESIGGLDALVSEVQGQNVTPLRPVESYTLDELDKEQYAANRDPEADTDEQFD